MESFEEAYRSMRLKFRSANDIPIERATITREEWSWFVEQLATVRPIREMMIRVESDLNPTKGPKREPAEEIS